MHLQWTFAEEKYGIYQANIKNTCKVRKYVESSETICWDTEEKLREIKENLYSIYIWYINMVYKKEISI
jgi:hypothetical protein